MAIVESSLDPRTAVYDLTLPAGEPWLYQVRAGQVLRIVATDPGSVKDFAAFARQTGNELLEQHELPDKAYEFFLRRK